MKGHAVLLLFACCFLRRGNADDDFFGDDYAEEDPWRLALRRLRAGRKYEYIGGGETRRNVNDDELENWTGRWMPDRPNDPTPSPKVFPKGQQIADFGNVQAFHGVPMGIPSANCDDAKTNLTVDWDGSPISYTCFDGRIVPDRNVIAIKYCERIPKYYVATHKCMQESIEYDDDVPLLHDSTRASSETHLVSIDSRCGPHRPLWPVYGEYKFLPKQRWLHSLEHGAVVALYHPCANPMEVKRLKNLLTGCLRRHVISPYNLLDERRPLALITWGCRLTMSYVHPEVVIGFIREHALRGAEDIAGDGDFNENLLRRAKIVSDPEDKNLCPNQRGA